MGGGAPRRDRHYQQVGTPLKQPDKPTALSRCWLLWGAVSHERSLGQSGWFKNGKVELFIHWRSSASKRWVTQSHFRSKLWSLTFTYIYVKGTHEGPIAFWCHGSGGQNFLNALGLICQEQLVPLWLMMLRSGFVFGGRRRFSRDFLGRGLFPHTWQGAASSQTFSSTTGMFHLARAPQIES